MPVRNSNFYSTYILISLPRWNSCISKPFQKECLSLSYSLVGMKFAQFLSYRVLTLACLVDQMDRMSRENFFQAPVEHRCRSTVVSIYHSNLVCFRQPSKTPIVVRRLPPLEFVRRIQTAWLPSQSIEPFVSNEDTRCLVQTFALFSTVNCFEPLKITRPGVRAYLPISSVELIFELSLNISTRFGRILPKFKRRSSSS